jgi:signal transduction histidine kinase
MRTTLTIIKWSAERLKKTDLVPLGPEGKQEVETIEKEIQRMIALINDILDTSRLEAGTLVIQPYSIDIAGALKTVVSELKPVALVKEQHIDEQYEPTSLLMNADPTLLRVVFQNLLSNAIKYTPQGGTITARIVRTGFNILIVITDTGYGIPEAEKPKVFGKLFRGQGAHKADPVGTGLGLYIVKSIVEASGGSIRFDSTEGKGTTFYVSYPLSGMRGKLGNVHLTSDASRGDATITP